MKKSLKVNLVSISFFSSDRIKVCRVIKSLMNTRSAGWDVPPANLANATAHQILKPLPCLINYSFLTRIGPFKLKFCGIKLLQKNTYLKYIITSSLRYIQSGQKLSRKSFLSGLLSSFYIIL